MSGLSGLVSQILENQIPHVIHSTVLSLEDDISEDVLSFESSNGISPSGSIKGVLDELFKDIVFDSTLINRIATNNIDFITTNDDIRDMMGGKLIGCYDFTYTHYHKALFYTNVFDMEYDDVRDAIKKITTIPSTFKISRDDINLTCFYVVHRFMKSNKLSKQEKDRGCIEILNYFGYRCLVNISSDYWQYPIDVGKATTLSESLSRSFYITEFKNWNEYVHKRSEVYMKGNYVKNIIELTNDKKIPNSINDLFNRYKDTIKKIYAEFDRLESDNIIQTSRNVVTDLEGRDVLLDRMNDPRSYVDKVLNAMVSNDMFIRRDIVEVSSTIVTSISQDQLSECLDLILKYSNSRGNKLKEVQLFITDFITDMLSYLQERKMFINNNANVVEIVNVIVGNILYSRGTGISITKLKDRGEVLIKQVYKSGGVDISSRNLSSMRNIFCVYLLILSLV